MKSQVEDEYEAEIAALEDEIGDLKVENRIIKNRLTQTVMNNLLYSCSECGTYSPSGWCCMECGYDPS